jgi:copper homeostasis protein
MTAHGTGMLEVIALTAEDAVAAEQGGADRLEVVSRIDVGGLTPDLMQFELIRSAVALPLRVMLRRNGGFSISKLELEQLADRTQRLLAAGAEEFVYGFLNRSGDLDLYAIRTLNMATGSAPWTLHHAFDHANNGKSAWEVARTLPSLDFVLSGGVRGDLSRGLEVLRERVDWQKNGPRWLAGGGLVLEHVPSLRLAGISTIHTGRGAREGFSWHGAVDPHMVERWRIALDAV